MIAPASVGLSTVDIWYVDLEVSPARLAELSQYLDDEEHARAARFHFDRDRSRFVAARGTLRAILARYLDTTPRLVCFHYGAQGKPLVRNEDLHFNISHSDGLLLVGVSRAGALGLDIERIPPSHVVDPVSTVVFSQPERKTLKSVSSRERPECFGRFWTRKEAYIKAVGGGMSIELTSLDVATAPGRVLQYHEGVGQWLRCPGWTLRPLPVRAGFAGALAAPGEWQIVRRDLPVEC
jgi:4'-phosphopantetheinyl transferase